MSSVSTREYHDTNLLDRWISSMVVHAAQGHEVKVIMAAKMGKVQVGITKPGDHGHMDDCPMFTILDTTEGTRKNIKVYPVRTLPERLTPILLNDKAVVIINISGVGQIRWACASLYPHHRQEE